MAQPGLQRHACRTRLARIQLPGMDVEHRRSAFTMDAGDCLPRHGIRQKAEIAAAATGPVSSQQARRGDRYLNQGAGSVGPVGPPWGIGEGIEIPRYRIDARTICMALLLQDRPSPGRMRPYAEGGGAIAQHGLARAVLQDRLGLADIGSKFLRCLAVHTPVTKTMAGDFMA